MRTFRFISGTTSITLAALLLTLTFRDAVPASTHLWVLAIAISSGNAWAWLCIDARNRHRMERLNRRMTHVLAADDLAKIHAAISEYHAQEKGNNL